MPVPTLVSTVEKGAGETSAGNRITDWTGISVRRDIWKYQAAHSALLRHW